MEAWVAREKGRTTAETGQVVSKGRKVILAGVVAVERGEDGLVV